MALEWKSCSMDVTPELMCLNQCFFFELHNTAETLTTHAYPSLLIHARNPRSIFEDCVGKSSRLNWIILKIWAEGLHTLGNIHYGMVNQ
jgi:hypothetical protein